MPIGNGNNTEKEFMNLKLSSTVGPTDEKPMFVKLGADFKETDEKYSFIEGKLIKIKGTHSPAKGRMGEIFGFKAFFEDENIIYVVESTITNASKDLLNALLVNIGETLKVSLYLNKNGYPTSSVKLANGNYAQTAFEYNKLDMKELYNAIESAEEAQEVSTVTKKTSNKKEEEIAIEDIPF